MKKTNLVILLGIAFSTPTLAASPGAVMAAVKAAAGIDDIQAITVVENGSCADCATIKVEGTGRFGNSYVKIKTECPAIGEISAVITETSK